MAKLANLARMSTATTGTGAITLGSAVTGYLTFAQAGIVNGDVISYGIKDGNNSEVGTGTYTAASTSLTRTVTNSTNAGAAISLSGSAEVFVTALATDAGTAKADVNSPVFTGTPTSTTPAVDDNSTRVSTTAWVFAQFATAAQYLNNTANKILSTDKVWSAAALTTLTDAATVTPDFSAGINFIWTLGATGRTIANPTSPKVGQAGIIYLAQDGTGSRTITTWGTQYKFPAGTKPTLSTTAGAIDAVSYAVKSATEILCTFSADFK